MPISTEQIARYLEGRCAPAEQREIADYLQAHPEVLEQFLDQQGWGAEITLPEEQSERMLTAIRRRTVHTRSRRILWPLVGAVAAAAIAGIMIWYRPVGEQPVHRASAPIAQAPVKKAPAVTVLHIYNNADSVVRLPDGSLATLRSSAELRYDSDYGRQHRNLQLSGEAVFDVASQAALPFTVHSGNVSTTALGTVFMVSAPEHTHRVKVRLLSGKVVVKMKDSPGTYLAPGQELAWNETSNKLAVYAWKQPVKPAAATPVAMPEATVLMHDGQIEFVKCPVGEVFSVLRREYGLQITARPEDLKGCFFSGTLIGQQEADDVIYTIVALNQLTLTKDNTGYHIRK
ncbi:FecR family protein [Chitinophaga qingshengii]|uniref:FecR family protein n=1 Tax=Chitinophaga qingshengii TaxID=1569794 RepID=A0ABR7TSH3_9BACT|nr:FecR family protein [Chitinophaga qingshengii]MBC9932970.1 FecR family protein [Chitinophaga qingshengii]